MQIHQLKTKKEVKQFVQMAKAIYKDNEYWVPPIDKGELQKLFLPNSPFRDTHEWAMWMVYEKRKPVGRIWAGFEKDNPRTVFWGWWEQINDPKVTDSLFSAVVKWAKTHKAKQIEGPKGFSAFDKVGLLTEGFEELPTVAESYHLPYYKELLRTTACQALQEYYSYTIPVPQQIPAKVKRMSHLLQKRNGWSIEQPKGMKSLREAAKEMFGLMTLSHADLPEHRPMPEALRSFYIEEFLPLVRSDYTCLVRQGKDGALIGFGIALPSYSRALQAMNGKLLPFGWWHIMKTKRKHETADLLLIGVHPEQRNKGVTACIFESIMSAFISNGVKRVESNQERSDNEAVQKLWASYQPRKHKIHQTYLLSL